MAKDKALYPELKITVQGDGTVTVRSDTSGEQATDGRISTDELLRETLTTLRDWLNEGKLKTVTETDLQLLGKLLDRLLFPPECGPNVKGLVHKQLKEAQVSHKCICVQLEFAKGQTALASLPWEFLLDPVSQRTLATTNDLVLTRFVSLEMTARVGWPAVELPLRMLIVVSKLSELNTVVAKEVIKSIREFADANPGRISLDEPLVNANVLELKRRLEQKTNQPHIVHVIGHGRYNKNKKKGEVALMKMDGKGVDWVDQDRFQRLFTDAGCIPRLVFLQLCEGATVEQGELITSFEGLAPTLVFANVQAAVGMQFPITNLQADNISRTFYEELSSGNSIGQAVQAARRRVSTVDPVAGGTPVLYMFGYDGAIAPRITSGGTLANASSATTRSSSDKPELGSGTQTPVSGEKPQPSPREGGALSTALDEISAAADAQLNAIKKERCPNPRDVTDEFMSLSRKLYTEVIPALRGKAVAQMKQVLGDFYNREANTDLRKVLDKMLEAAERMP